MANTLQPTGLLARVMFFHEQGARLEVLSQRSSFNERGLIPDQWDNSRFLRVGSEVKVNNDWYEVITVSLQFMDTINGDLGPNTYFTDTREDLPNNLFIHVMVRLKQ